MSLTGDADGPPYRAGVAVFDVITGLHAAVAILAALHHRERTGEGQQLETNLLSAALSGLVNQTSAVLTGGVVPSPARQRAPEPVPLRAAAHRRRRADRHRGQRPPVPPARRRRSAHPSCSTTRASARCPTATPTATSCARCCWPGSPRGRAQEWFDILAPAGVPCGPINTDRRGPGPRRAARAGPGGGAGRGAERAQPGRRTRATPPSYRRPPPAPGRGRRGDPGLARAALTPSRDAGEAATRVGWRPRAGSSGAVGRPVRAADAAGGQLPAERGLARTASRLPERVRALAAVVRCWPPCRAGCPA